MHHALFLLRSPLATTTFTSADCSHLTSGLVMLNKYDLLWA
jgi:hypothetical protein